MKKFKVNMLLAISLIITANSAEAGWGRTLAGAAVAGAVGGYVAGKVAQPAEVPKELQTITVEPSKGFNVIYCPSLDGARCIINSEVYYTRHYKYLAIPYYVSSKGFLTYGKFTPVPCTEALKACYGENVNYLIAIEVK